MISVLSRSGGEILGKVQAGDACAAPLGAPAVGRVDFAFFACGEGWQALGLQYRVDAGNALGEAVAKNVVRSAPLRHVAFKVDGFAVGPDENGRFVTAFNADFF